MCILDSISIFDSFYMKLLESLVEEYFSQRQEAFVCANINVYIKCFDRDKWFKLAREESSVLFAPEATVSVVILEFVRAFF